MQKNSTLSRRSEIIKILNTKMEVSVSALSKLFSISEVSIRNDLSHLESKGLLIRTRGGAIVKQPVNFDLSLNQKIKKNYKQKQAIGKKTIEFINNHDSIVIDSGSTTLEIAKHLKKFKNLHIITNSLPIAEQVADYKDIEVIIPGGVLRSEMRSLVGSFAEKNLENFYCDLAVLGADSIDPHSGIYTPLEVEAALSSKMMQIAKKVIVVADSSKFKRKSFVRICQMEKIDVLITDSGISKEALSQLELLELELVIV